MESPVMSTTSSRADPIADNTIARIMGPWQMVEGNSAQAHIEAHVAKWAKLRAVTKLMRQWTTNESLDNWACEDDALNADAIAALQAYVREARALPDWAVPAQINRAEQIFLEQGALSCVLLFCASLPECYVVPDLASVLHISGQLEAHTDYRIRSTAAMIFPVMMPAGMTSTQSSGIAQVLKVRLIHATIRHLILRGNPSEAKEAVEPITALAGTSDMFQALYAHGWDVSTKGLPCDQEELAYTLLTFGFIYLRSLRKLGLPLPAADEAAFLHCWNVMGHVLGIERGLMRVNYDEAAQQFEQLQSQGLQQVAKPDARPRLGQALMHCMENEIPVSLLKGIPSLMTCHLCTDNTAALIGVNSRAGFVSRLVFWLLMAITRTVDSIVRWVMPQFSLSRLLTRMVGDRLMEKVLMDQTRPLKLPTHLNAQMQSMIKQWQQHQALG
jgi:ER-bound oxygenase mpaB/B'/Rubber oxygenase, catalytic domain